MDELAEPRELHRPDAAARVRARPGDPCPVGRAELAELIRCRERRARSAAEHVRACERAVRRQRERLAVRRLGTVADGPKRLRADLAELRLAVAGEAADGLRRLRDDAREQLERLDRAGRAEFPARLGTALAGLYGQVGGRLSAALAQLEHAVHDEWGGWCEEPGPVTRDGPARAGAIPDGVRWQMVMPDGATPDVIGHGAAGDRGAWDRPVPDELPAVPARRGWEVPAMLVAAASFGAGLVRFALLGESAFGLTPGTGFGTSRSGAGPGTGWGVGGSPVGPDGSGFGPGGAGFGPIGSGLGPVLLALVVAAGAAAACGLVGARRAAADRAVLGRWTVEVLADARAGLDSWVSGRVLDAERRLLAPVERAVATRAAGLDSELREQAARATALLTELATRRAEDAATLTRLRSALADLDRQPTPDDVRGPV